MNWHLKMLVKRWAILQVTLRLIKKVFLLKTLGKVEQVLICLQHRLIDLVKHGWHLPLLNFFTFSYFFVIKNFVTPNYAFKVFGFF